MNYYVGPRRTVDENGGGGQFSRQGNCPRVPIIPPKNRTVLARMELTQNGEL